MHVGTEAALLKGQPLVAADERTPLAFDSRSPYAATKAEAEAAVIGANGDGLATVVVRPRFVWGAGDTTLLPELTELARTGQLRWVGGGRHLTSTTHVENTVEGLVLAAERGRPGNAYFVTDGSPVVFREFVTALVATQGVQAPEGEVPVLVARALAAAGEAAWKRAPAARRAAALALRAVGLLAGVHARRRQGARPPRLRADHHARARADRAPGGRPLMDLDAARELKAELLASREVRALDAGWLALGIAPADDGVGLAVRVPSRAGREAAVAHIEERAAARSTSARPARSAPRRGSRGACARCSPGFSVAHVDVTAGTIGAFVTRGESGCAALQ